MRLLYPLLLVFFLFTNCNKEHENFWLFCIQAEIEAFKLNPDARWIIKQDFDGEPIFTFGNTNGGFIMNARCELICPEVCLLCAHGGFCEGKDFYGATSNSMEIWRK